MSAPPNASWARAATASICGRVGEVRLDRERLAAVRLDRRDGLAQLLGLQPGGEHARAAGGEQRRGGGADAGRGAGDDRGLAGHGHPLLRTPRPPA